jgi:EAL domain-containing protein (putative c-di-GMP-specific phosphodiesterase class I)
MKRKCAAPGLSEDGLQPARVGEGSCSVWYLVGQLDPRGGTQRIPINSVPFQVGRRGDLSLAIANQTVSAVHAEIAEEDGWLTLRDLASTNGTYVNGTSIMSQATLFEGDVIQFAEVPFRLERQVTGHNDPTAIGDPCDRAAALLHFDQLMEGEAVVPFFQPIVRLDAHDTIGYEIVSRSRLEGLMTPAEMFAVAGQLNAQGELSQLLRREGLRAGAALPAQANLFVNTHPVELAASGLAESLTELRRLNADRPMTLEIHEAAITDLLFMRELERTLRDLSIDLAFDDFGAGQTRLVELIEIRPDVLKFDMRFIQGVHTAPAHRQEMLANLVEMVTEWGITPLAEGIECEAESTVCQQLGFVLAQGFYFGHPAPVVQYINEGLQ